MVLPFFLSFFHLWHICCLGMLLSLVITFFPSLSGLHCFHLHLLRGFPGGSDGKETACNVGDWVQRVPLSQHCLISSCTTFFCPFLNPFLFSDPLANALVHQFGSVQSLNHGWLCNPMDYSTPGYPVHHQLPGLAQTHIHWVGDAIQPSHPLSSPSPPAFNLSHHQGLFRATIYFLHVLFRVKPCPVEWTFLELTYAPLLVGPLLHFLFINTSHQTLHLYVNSETDSASITLLFSQVHINWSDPVFALYLCYGYWLWWFYSLALSLSSLFHLFYLCGFLEDIWKVSNLDSHHYPTGLWN